MLDSTESYATARHLLITPYRAAVVAQVSRRTMANLIETGKVATFFDGRRTMVLRAAAEALKAVLQHERAA